MSSVLYDNLYANSDTQELKLHGEGNQNNLLYYFKEAKIFLNVVSLK